MCDRFMEKQLADEHGDDVTDRSRRHDEAAISQTEQGHPRQKSENQCRDPHRNKRVHHGMQIEGGSDRGGPVIRLPV